jgi:cardiolipin synthase A/B
MLAAIESRRAAIDLVTYIFDSDDTGKAFADALGRAVARGVEVRCCSMAWASCTPFPGRGACCASGASPVRRFLPPRLLPPSFMINLRNHRKILLVDDGWRSPAA